jgi:hypothetical protein
MIKYTGYHPEINKILNELTDLKTQSELLANDLMRPDEHRNFSRATADAYGYCIIRLISLGIPKEEKCS